MTLDEKVKIGLLAIAGISVVLTALGVTPNPLDDVGGAGMS